MTGYTPAKYIQRMTAREPTTVIPVRDLAEALDLLDKLTDGLLPLPGPFQVYRQRVDTWKGMMRGMVAEHTPT